MKADVFHGFMRVKQVFVSFVWFLFSGGDTLLVET